MTAKSLELGSSFIAPTMKAQAVALATQSTKRRYITPDTIMDKSSTKSVDTSGRHGDMADTPFPSAHTQDDGCFTKATQS